MLADGTLGGLGPVGMIGCGHYLAPIGRTANLDIVQGQLGSAVVDFDHETLATDTDTPAAGVVFAVYVDRVLTTFTTPGEGFDSDPMADGAHSINIIPVPANSRGFPSYIPGDVQGSRVWLSWARATATDLESYLVYWDAGAGGAVSTLLATVDRVAISPRYGVTPDSGSGTGRLTIDGTYRGDTINQTWKVKVISASAGTYQYSQDAGSTYNGTDLEFFEGTIANLPNGLRIRFMDALSTYANNDTWDIVIGPATHYETVALSDGTYQFAVKAKDAAGNLGTVSSTSTIVLAQEPAPPTNIAATYSAGTISLTWTASTTASLDGYNIYTNLEQIFDARLDYINELATVQTAASGATSANVTVPANAGEWMLYVRAVKSGVEERNASMVRVSGLTSPPSTLPAPVILSAEAVASGYVTLTYQIDRTTTDPTSLRVYVHTTSTPDFTTPYATITYSSVATDFPVDTLTYTTSGTIPAQRWFTIRAVDGSGNATNNTDVTACTPDSTAPSQVTGLEAWQT